MFDLHPATRELARLVTGVRDDQLRLPTPCTGVGVGSLLAHIDGLAEAFARAAAKSLRDAPPPSMPDPDDLAAGWRTRIPDRLAALAEAWRAPGAWTGTTHVGGVDLPGDVAAAVAVSELVLHGWDLAVSTGQGFRADPGPLAAAHGFVQATTAEHPEGIPGLYGRRVPVPDDAAPTDRLLGLAGRDPAWRAPARQG